MSITDRKRILCVEDDPDSCDLLGVLLGEHEVVTAATVKKGVDLARVGGFDLYILDGSYPDGSGVELCRQIRAVDAHTPILFFTGLAEDSDIQDGLSAGAQAYLIKPDDIEALSPTVARLLKIDPQD